MSSARTIQIGPGFAGLLTILFVALKLTHVINWSWLWVVSPIWISVGLSILFLLGILAVALVLAWRESR